MTDDWYDSGRVRFSDDGKYLLLSSSRDFKPTFGEKEFENVYVDMQRVYLVTLSKDTRVTARTAERRGRQSEKERQGEAGQGERSDNGQEGKKDEESERSR